MAQTPREMNHELARNFSNALKILEGGDVANFYRCVKSGSLISDALDAADVDKLPPDQELTTKEWSLFYRQLSHRVECFAARSGIDKATLTALAFAPDQPQVEDTDQDAVPERESE